MIAEYQIRREAEDRFGKPNRGMSSRHELRFGRKGAVSVRLTGNNAGAWYDFEAAEGGWLTNSRPDGYERAAPRTGGERAESADSFRETRAGLKALAGTPGETYLRSRGITRWPVHLVRWSPDRHGVAFLAIDAEGTPRACQIVYLTPDGRKQDRHDGVTKRTLAAVRGWHEIAAMRLPGNGEPILCEGPETALSIWVALDCRRSVHACLGRAGLGALVVRNKRICIARDGDEDDSQADASLWRAVQGRQRAGKTVRVATPPLHQDFNDVLDRIGPAEVVRIIRGAATPSPDDVRAHLDRHQRLREQARAERIEQVGRP